MEKKIILIALSVFMMSILASMDFIVQPSYSIDFVDKTVTSNPTTMVRHTINGVTVFSTIAESTNTIQTFKGSDGSLLYSVSMTSVAESHGATGGSAIARAMTCSNSICNVLFGVTAGSVLCRIVSVIPATGQVDLRLNVTSTNGCASAMGQSGNSLYVSGTSGSSNDRLYEVDTTQTPYVATELNSFVGMGSPTACIVPLTLGANFYIGLCGSGTNAWFKLFRVSTATTCSVTGTFTAEDVATDGTFAFVSLSDGTVKEITSACAVSSTISTATCGGEIHDIEISGDIMFTFCEATTSGLTTYNLTSNSKLVQYDCHGSSNGIGNYVKAIAYDSALDVIACAAYSGNNVRFIYQTGIGFGSGGNPPGSSNGVCLNVDSNGDGTVNLLDCLSGQGALAGLLPANQNITTVGTKIGQGVGLIDPNNSNPRTNGVGLFFMLIVGTFFAIALMTAVHTLNMRGYISASVKEIDAIFWLFLVVGTVSVSWYLKWIDDIVFAAMTVGLAGLIAFGVLKHFRG